MKNPCANKLTCLPLVLLRYILFSLTLILSIVHPHYGAAISSDAISVTNTFKDSLNQNALTQNTLTQNTLNQNTLNQNTLNQNALTQNTLTQNSLNQNTLNQNTLNQNSLNQKNQFNGVKERLLRDGFTIDEVSKIYNNPKISLELKGVSLFFVHSESSLDYDQFLSNKSINNALSYIKIHEAELAHAQAIYGVDKTVITAIILVETRLGTYLGNRVVINTLSTMSALSERNQREMLWNYLSDERRIERDKFDKKADSKANWAYQELKALIKYAAREGIDPVEIKGSYAGALGIAQFMPSNLLTLAKDGNLDGKVDLFNHADAIHSIANYLKHYGWQPTVNRAEAHQILYKYNHSNNYVDTLLKVSDLLKNKNI